VVVPLDKKPVIVVIEDDPEIREMVSEVLGELSSYTICTASSSEEGLAKINKAEDRLALVITDLNIGSDSGGKLLAKLDRNGSYLRNVPRIIMSGTLEEDYLERKKKDRLGRYDYWIQKPAEVSMLLSTVRRLLN
jgi:DNA-binding NtrC family response regulator